MNAAEFWGKVDTSAGPDACWPWMGHSLDDEYGRLKHDGRTIAAHRLAYILSKGDIPVGMIICHACDNMPCCNPNHLFAGTHADNANDFFAKGKRRVPIENLWLEHARKMLEGTLDD